MERERICPEREKSVLETTLFPSFFTRSENNNNLKKLLSLLSLIIMSLKYFIS